MLPAGRTLRARRFAPVHLPRRNHRVCLFGYLHFVPLGSTMALADQISREFNVSDRGIDMEIEFTDDAHEATGAKLYLQLKSGDSCTGKRRSGRQMASGNVWFSALPVDGVAPPRRRRGQGRLAGGRAAPWQNPPRDSATPKGWPSANGYAWRGGATPSTSTSFPSCAWERAFPRSCASSAAPHRRSETSPTRHSQVDEPVPIWWT